MKLGEFDLSVPDKVTVLKTIPETMSTPSSGDDRLFLVCVDLASDNVTNVTLPAGYKPAYQSLGSPAVIDEQNRELVLSVEHPLTPGSVDKAYSLLKFNQDTQQFTAIKFPCTRSSWPTIASTCSCAPPRPVAPRLADCFWSGIGKLVLRFEGVVMVVIMGGPWSCA